MNKEPAAINRLVRFSCFFLLLFVFLTAGAAFCADAVNVILQNNSSGSVEVELLDQYGGNFTASIDPGMSTNSTVKANSEIKVGGAVVHVVTAVDEGKEIIVAN
ncbi:MAG TPA: hypothetical protein DDY20_04885 [Desulfobulbaceae bacterium]|nr:hypothetical protein [Desulfobulbaceae bacterium]